MKQTIKVAKDQGAHVQGTISYTLSPVHTLDDFVDLAKELEDLAVVEKAPKLEGKNMFIILAKKAN